MSPSGEGNRISTHRLNGSKSSFGSPVRGYVKTVDEFGGIEPAPLTRTNCPSGPIILCRSSLPPPPLADKNSPNGTNGRATNAPPNRVASFRKSRLDFGVSGADEVAAVGESVLEAPGDTVGFAAGTAFGDEEGAVELTGAEGVGVGELELGVVSVLGASVLGASVLGASVLGASVLGAFARASVSCF